MILKKSHCYQQNPTYGFYNSISGKYKHIKTYKNGKYAKYIHYKPISLRGLKPTLCKACMNIIVFCYNIIGCKNRCFFAQTESLLCLSVFCWHSLFKNSASFSFCSSSRHFFEIIISLLLYSLIIR